MLLVHNIVDDRQKERKCNCVDEILVDKPTMDVRIGSADGILENYGFIGLGL